MGPETGSWRCLYLGSWRREKNQRTLKRNSWKVKRKTRGMSGLEMMEVLGRELVLNPAEQSVRRTEHMASAFGYFNITGDYKRLLGGEDII